MLGKQVSQIDATILDLQHFREWKIFRPKLQYVSSSCVQIGFITQGRCSNNKNEYHDYHRAGGVLSLNQKLQATAKNEDELRRTRGNPNGIYGKRKEDNSRELLNNGGARTNSGQIRLMQQPLLRRWRKSTVAAELGC